MSNRSQSQWDFGELFAAEATRRVLSVSELTSQLKRLLEQQVGPVWVSGEVTNLRRQTSGHAYFTLKDVAAQISCVLFRGETRAQRQLLSDGQKLLVHGDLTVYEARGQYQLIVHTIELQGVGALQVAFEKLRQKLANEGLFASARKRALPNYPRHIGLVTSPTGAAIRDVLHVAQRRNPGLEILLAPCRVQGQGAAGEIVAAIRLLNEFSIRHPEPALDLILITRGGGSLEDLWAFNEEIVARAIFDSAIPVVSAIGHEIDFTISDFVADVRAATPSAAAEIITEAVFGSREFVTAAPGHMARRVRQTLAVRQESFAVLRHRMRQAHPRRRVNEFLQRLDDLASSLARSARQAQRNGTVQTAQIARRLARAQPRRWIRGRRDLFSQTWRRLHEHAQRQLRERWHEFYEVHARLRLLDPMQVLARGYSITTDAETGEILRDAGLIKAGQRLTSRLKVGAVKSRVEI